MPSFVCAISMISKLGSVIDPRSFQIRFFLYFRAILLCVCHSDHQDARNRPSRDVNYLTDSTVGVNRQVAREMPTTMGTLARRTSSIHKVREFPLPKVSNLIHLASKRADPIQANPSESDCRSWPRPMCTPRQIE